MSWVLVAGMIVAAALAALTVLASWVRGRAWAMLGALVLTPVLLVAEVWDSPQLEPLRARGSLAAVVAALALVATGALAWLFARRPAVLAVLALAALPFRVPVQVGGSTANLLVPLYVVIAAGALAWLVPRLTARNAGREASRSGGLEWALLGGVVLYALQAVYAADRTQAFEQVVFFSVPFALLFAVLRELEWTPRRLRWGGGALAGLALVFAAVGLWEFGTRHVALNPRVIAANEVQEYFRVNSLFFDADLYGRFLALVMIGLASVLLWARRPRSLAWTIAALVVLWGGLLTTLSYSSFAALLVGLAALAWLRFGARVVIAPALVAVVAGAVLHVQVRDTESLTHAASGRAELVQDGLALARAKPLLGWGAGSFQTEYRRHERPSDRAATAASHTTPVTVAAEQGILGLALYVALLVLAVRRLLRGARGAPVRAALAAGFFALVAHTWLYAAFLADPLTWTLLAIGSALAVPVIDHLDFEDDAATSLNGHRKEPVVVARSGW
jgi:O-antigen ligase